MSSLSQSRLFKPLKVGNMELQTRISMAPMTRSRNTAEHVPLSFVANYYGQRSSTPGTLLVTEATLVSEKHGGYPNVPGIWNQAQIDGWKPVTEEVHKKGGFIFQQLWALGRVANPQYAAATGIPIKSASATQLEGLAVAEEMTEEDIQDVITAYTQAAKNSIAAGFDGVELHGANGYLIHQFIEDVTNQRTDRWGGNVENRARLALEVVKAVVDAIGAERTAIRFSPFNTFQGMGMADPLPQYSYLLSQLNGLGLAYVHLVSGRVMGVDQVTNPQSLTPILEHYSGPVIIAGGYVAETAKYLVDEEYPERDVLVGIGRQFLSTPDLVFRYKHGLEMNGYKRNLFYGPQTAEGYDDYPFSKEFEIVRSEIEDSRTTQP